MSRTGCTAPPPIRSRCSPGYRARGPSGAARQPGSPSGPSLQAGQGAASPRPYVTGAGVAGAGTGLPGPGKLSGARAGGAGVNLPEVLRDARALSSLPLPRCGGGGGLGGGSPRPREVCKYQGRRGQAQPGWSRGEWEGRRGATPRGLGCCVRGWCGRPIPPSLGARLPPGLLQKDTPDFSPWCPWQTYPLALSHHPREPQLGSHLLCVSLSASLSFQSSALLPEPPSWSPIPGNTPPCPCLPPSLCTVQPQTSPPALPGQCLRLPHPPTPDPVASSAQRLLEGSWRMPPGSPPLGPRRALGSGFTHRCPELLRAARAGSRRSRLARPSPAPWGGREGAGPGGAGLRQRSPGPRPPFCACPSPRRPSPTCVSFRLSCRGLFCVTVAGLNLRAPSTGEVWLPPSPTRSEGLLDAAGKGSLWDGA